MTTRPSARHYKPYTLVGPTVTRPVQDPLAVLNLDNRLLYMAFTCPLPPLSHLDDCVTYKFKHSGTKPLTNQPFSPYLHDVIHEYFLYVYVGIAASSGIF